MKTKPMASARRPVRQATLLNVSWSESRGAFELTLKDDAGEYVLHAASEDADALLGVLVADSPEHLNPKYRITRLANDVASGRPESSRPWAEASLMQT
jgi:hypothetical protein